MRLLKLQHKVHLNDYFHATHISEGMQFIQSVASAASDISGYSMRSPEEEALFRFRCACQLIDEFCALDDVSTSKYYHIVALIEES